MSRTERQGLLWLIVACFAGTFVSLLVLHALYGCAPLSPSQDATAEAHHDITVQAVDAAIDARAASVVNDLWPIVTLVLGGASVATAGVLTGLGIWWYRRRKNGNARREELIRCIEEASR